MPDSGWQERGYRNIWMPYAQMKTEPLPAAVVATEGVRLRLADGTELIDGLGSWWSACHGYNHPHIIQAVRRQLEVMPHVMFGGINHPPALDLASRLAGLLPGDLNRVFFCDSGSVSVEVALKIAAQFWRNRGQPQRSRFLSFRHAYHGDTMGAMSVCDPINSMHAHFEGFMPQQLCRPLPKTDDDFQCFVQELDEADSQLAGVLIEPLVQGAGGMKFHSAELLARICAICQDREILLIADEVATGFGRTGSMFACQQADIVPDIICLSKALTGGTMGMAATVATDRVFEAFLSDNPSHALMHGPTFMANPLACSAALASLDLFDREPRLRQAMAIERQLAEELEPCRNQPGVVDVRAKGAVGVVQVESLPHLDQLRQQFVSEGVWIRPFANMIYVTPPLVIDEDDLRRLTSAIVKVVRGWIR